MNAEELVARLAALEASLKTAKEDLEKEKAIRAIDVKKVGEAFSIIHSPDS